MAACSTGRFLERLRTTLRSPDDEALQDAQLLHRFIANADESAFATIVRRHGGMVMRVCRRLLREPHDAEDAFQATFLILVRKAASIARQELLGNWLYGVAYNTALKARAITMRCRTREKQLDIIPDRAAAERAPQPEELFALLDLELSRLPPKYRSAIVLCELEGKSRREAAKLLGCPEGSLSSRLARARALLAKRLSGRGLLITSGLLASLLAQDTATANVSAAVLSSVVRSATALAAGGAAMTVVSPKVVALVEGVLKTMLLAKLRTGMTWLTVSLAVLGTGFAVFQKTMAQTRPDEPAQGATPPSSSKDGKQPGPQSGVDLKEDFHELQGKWAVLSQVSDGDEAPEQILKQVFAVFDGHTFTFRPGFSFHVQDGKTGYSIDENPDEFPFQLKGGTRHKEMHLAAVDAENKVHTIYAIYKLDGDHLTLCIGDPNGRGDPPGLRPTQFTGQKGSNQSLWELNRVSRDLEPGLRASWGLVRFGQVRPGEEVSRKVVVRSATPFRILEVRGGEGIFEASDLDKDSKSAHNVTITFKPAKEGEIARTLKVVTDMKSENEIEIKVVGTGK
jgi:RNA polymerase sigma factor (sigma-70 family)